MSEFFLAFGLLVLIFLGSSLVVLLIGKLIYGWCGGLIAISGCDSCVV
mgnify:CR=1 FL=1